MVMKHNIIYTLAIAFLVTACIEDNFTNIPPDPGTEVLLSANVNKTHTRTLYGIETNNKVPIYWVHGDTISVFGVDCLAGRKQADYTVNTINPENGSTTPETQNDYAFSLDKVGEYGVQWGNQETSDFYAIYPSTKGTFSEDESGSVTVTTNIRASQKNKFVETKVGDKTVWVGTPYVNDLNNPTMRDALMYAYTSSASSKAPQVDLKFHPFSTVLKFYINGWSGEGIETGLKAYVNKIILTAPEGVGIAGDCTFTFKNGVPTASNGTSNTITIYPDYLPMGENEAVEFHVYAIPHTNQMSLNEDWTVAIETSNFGNHTFKLKPKEGTKADLTPAKIHKINIPLRPVDMLDEVELPNNNWMEYIPRNIYLSELSVPGSWYSYHEAYQGKGNDIANQFENGVRAFHFDCRLNMPSSEQYTGTDAQKEKLKLVAAGTDNAGTNTVIFGVYGYNSGTEISTLMSQVAQLAATKPKEYVVVVLTIAEKPMTRSSNSNVFGTVDPSIVLPRIYSMLDENKDTWKLYYKKTVQLEGATQVVYGIDPNTTVNDVLTNGNVIVKINVNTTVANFDDYGSGCALVSQASMASEQDFIISPIIAGNFTEMNTDALYWGESVSATQTPSMHYYHHAAQKTNSDTDRGVSTTNVVVPTLGMRMDAIDDIISQSQEIYEKSAHNGWYQLGIGGYDADDTDDHETIARTLNSYVKGWVDDKIARKSRNGVALKPSPVGIVLMNLSSSNDESTTTGNGNGLGLIESIISLNTKFSLERDYNQEEWPDGKNPYEDLFNQSQATQTSYAEVEPLN